MCGFTSIPEWIRLWHEERLALSFSEPTTNVTRELFHSCFRQVTSPDGHPVAAYFPSDGSSLLVVSRDDDGWHARRGGVHRNRAVLDGHELGPAMVPIRDGSRLDIVAGSDGKILGTFLFRYR